MMILAYHGIRYISDRQKEKKEEGTFWFSSGMEIENKGRAEKGNTRGKMGPKYCISNEKWPCPEFRVFWRLLAQDVSEILTGIVKMISCCYFRPLELFMHRQSVRSESPSW